MKILLSGYTGLGNFILKTPFLATFKNLYPHAQIDIMVNSPHGIKALMAENAHINHMHVLALNSSYYQKMQFFRQQLRPIGYKALFLPFDANHNFLSIGSYIAGIPQRIRHIRLPNSQLKAAATIAQKYLCYPNTTFVPLLAHRHEIDLNYDLLSAFHQNVFTRHYQTQLAVPHNTPQTLAQFGVTAQQYLIIQCCAANGLYPAKIWPPQRFITLLQQLLQQYPHYKLVLVGDKGDYKASVQYIAQQFTHHAQVVVTAGQTSIAQLTSLLTQAKLVLCHDSGVMHMADALATPVLALYGPTDFTRTKPLKASSHLLFSETPHFAAMYNFKLSEKQLQEHGIKHAAMEGISVQQVMQKIRQLLA